MDFGNNNILQILERPPNKNNLSIYNIIQIILMVILVSLSGYKLFCDFFNYKISSSILFSIIIYGPIFIGFILSCYGFIKEKNIHLKTGFLLFFIGSLLLIIKDIIDIIKLDIGFASFCELIISILLCFVIMKQIQHL